MARCGCAGTTCSCKIIGEGGIVVTGAGTITNPYRVTGGVEMSVQDTGTIDLTLLGDGSTTNPYVLTANLTAGLDDLLDVETSGGTAGDVVALQADGSFSLVPPSTAAVGAISTGLSIEGDGSSGDPLDVRLDSLSGLEIAAGGLRIEPYTVLSEGVLDTTYGALPSGSIVADTDGLNAWLKSDTGWKNLLEDSGNVSGVAGNFTASSGFTVNNFFARRKNGIVSIQLGFTTTISRSTAYANGNMGNITVANVIPAEFRPVVGAVLRTSSTGPDDAFYLSSGGNVVWSNMAQPSVTYAAGQAWVINGTFIGA
jgi:hypothetical protein